MGSSEINACLLPDIGVLSMFTQATALDQCPIPLLRKASSSLSDILIFGLKKDFVFPYTVLKFLLN